jgi:hypothetical protein
MSRPPVRKQKVDEADVHTWFTRGETAEKLACSRGRVKQLEGKLLHPILIEGIHRFKPSEVEHLAQKRRGKLLQKLRRTMAVPKKLDSGAMAARVFELFDKQLSVGEIVKLLQIAPSEVAVLWKQYLCRRPEDLVRLEQQLKWDEQERQAQEQFERQLVEGQKSFNDTLTALVKGSAKK